MTQQVVSIVGYGQMGEVIARLLSDEWAIQVYDCMESRRAAATTAQYGVCSSLQPIAQAPTIVLALPGPVEVREVVQELVASTTSDNNQLIMDTTSIDPDTAREMATLCSAHRVRYVEVPVLGGPPQSGRWIFLGGGSDSDIAQAATVLRPLGSIVHFGAVGDGSRAKLLNNILTGLNSAAVAEVVALATRLGVDVGKLQAAIQQSPSAGRNAVLEIRVPQLVAGTLKDTFSMQLMLKDLHLAIQLAQSADQPMFLTATGVQMFQAAVSKGWGSRDIGYLTESLAVSPADPVLGQNSLKI